MRTIFDTSPLQSTLPSPSSTSLTAVRPSPTIEIQGLKLTGKWNRLDHLSSERRSRPRLEFPLRRSSTRSRSPTFHRSTLPHSLTRVDSKLTMKQ